MHPTQSAEVYCGLHQIGPDLMPTIAGWTTPRTYTRIAGLRPFLIHWLKPAAQWKGTSFTATLFGVLDRIERANCESHFHDLSAIIYSAAIFEFRD